MHPNFSMPFAAASRACPSFVTSSGCLSSRGWSAMDEGSRAVATTASPLVRTASMMRAPNPRDAPVMNQVFMSPVHSTERSDMPDSGPACDTQKCLRHDGVSFVGTGSGEHLRELDKVSPGVGEKRQPSADDGQLKWLGDDRHAAPAEFGDGFIDAGNVEAKVMEAREAQAVGQILIHRLRNRAGLAIAKQLDKERIVRCRRKVGKVLIRIGPLLHD